MDVEEQEEMKQEGQNEEQVGCYQEILGKSVAEEVVRREKIK